MLVVSNRHLTSDFASSGQGDQHAFGEQFNAKGAHEIRFAYANKTGKKWLLELLPEPEQLSSNNLPSKTVFKQLMKNCREQNKHCLLFVHGYNKPFDESLEQAWRIQQRYQQLEVVLFSWPSNPGGFFIKEYKQVKSNARASIGALDNLLEKLSMYSVQDFDETALKSCHVSLNLMTYSMGNLLLQGYIQSAENDGETRMFTNVILCQADCDNAGHERWVDTIQSGKRIYITINEEDKILGWSDANFQKDRLGRTARGLIAQSASYFDFTNAPKVGNTHQLWGEDTNDAVREFFQIAFTGGRPEDSASFYHDSRVNAFKVVAKKAKAKSK